MEFKISRFIYIFFIITIFNGCSTKDTNRYEDKEAIKGRIIINGWEWYLYLPYEINDDVEYVFSDWTRFAIDFVNISVDGKRLPVSTTPWLHMEIYEPSNAFKYTLHKVTEGKKEYYMAMTWRRIGLEGIYWEDYSWASRRGKRKHSRAYYIPRKSKKLYITYRIILPYPTLTPDNLFDKDYKYKEYTKEYKIIVDLKDFFESDSFNLVSKSQ